MVDIKAAISRARAVGAKKPPTAPESPSGANLTDAERRYALNQPPNIAMFARANLADAEWLAAVVFTRVGLCTDLLGGVLGMRRPVLRELEPLGTGLVVGSSK